MFDEQFYGTISLLPILETAQDPRNVLFFCLSSTLVPIVSTLREKDGYHHSKCRLNGVFIIEYDVEIYLSHAVSALSNE